MRCFLVGSKQSIASLKIEMYETYQAEITQIRPPDRDHSCSL